MLLRLICQRTLSAAVIYCMQSLLHALHRGKRLPGANDWRIAKVVQDSYSMHVATVTPRSPQAVITVRQQFGQLPSGNIAAFARTREMSTNGRQLSLRDVKREI
jgi:hypothetical protein